MAYSPITTARFCRAVPLDNTYKDTMTFSSATAQQSYFVAKTKLTYNELTYQREQLYIQVQTDYNNVIDCNYLCYQNPAFSNKWFYAFILNVEYINENNTRIYFEIDEYQTWQFEMTVPSAFVEREHPDTDLPGDNILPEPVDEGLMYYEDYTTPSVLTSFYYLMGVAADWSGGVIPNYYNDIFSGIELYAFENTDSGRAALAFEITRHETTKVGSVLWIATVPLLAINAYSIDPETHQLQSGSNVGMQEYIVPKRNSIMPTGYIPRNKKLLTSPYNYFSVSNNSGQIKEYHYEDFYGTTNMPFTIYCDLSATPTVRLQPVNYLNSAELFDAGVSINWDGQVSWVTDVYREWMQSNRLNFATREISSFLSGISLSSAQTPAGGNPAALANKKGDMSISLIQNQITYADENYRMRLKANKVNGNYGGNNLDLALELKAFRCYYVCSRTIDAQRIDAYFDRFGYTTVTNKSPNITGRTSWNYVKTSGAVVKGSAPVSALTRLRSMLNTGVTFWHTGEVGDYSQINVPI